MPINTLPYSHPKHRAARRRRYIRIALQVTKVVTIGIVVFVCLSTIWGFFSRHGGIDTAHYSLQDKDALSLPPHRLQIPARDVNAEQTNQAFKDLVARYFPTLLPVLNVQVLPATASGRMQWHLVTSSAQEIKEAMSTNALDSTTQLTIAGTNGVALASALYYYLKNYCKIEWLSWSMINEIDDGTSPGQYSPPEGRWPIVTTPLRITSPYLFSYYMNEVTFGYSYAFWGWERWERELDWAALHGINLILLKTISEPVVYKLFQELGLSDKEVLDDFLSSPGFEPWQRMGNIHGSWSPREKSDRRGWSKPMLDGTTTLTQQIYDRCRDLGITVILPAFNGFVPPTFPEHYPGVNLITTDAWNGFNQTFCCAPVLIPTDPWFHKLGTRYLELSIELLGGRTDHYYNSDTFNENQPPKTDPDYLADLAAAVYESMHAVDTNAIWVMQAWLFQDARFWGPKQISALLSKVPDSRMLLLDLWAEVNPIWSKTESFYGKSWLWCMLLNYGGSNGLYGRAHVVSKEPLRALRASQVALPGGDEKITTMLGIGITPEGIENNEFMYELMLDNMWHDTEIDVLPWISSYVDARYGAGRVTTARAVPQEVLTQCLDSAKTAWQQLYTSLYSCDTMQYSSTKSMIELIPRFEMKRPGFMPTIIYWKPADVQKVVGLLLGTHLREATEVIDQSEPLCGSVLASRSPQYRYDLVHVMAQVLNDIFYEVQPKIGAAYKAKNEEEFNHASSSLLSLIDDMDRLLATNGNFLFGRWQDAAIERARQIGQLVPDDPDEIARLRKMYQYNARNQVTMWGPLGEISDYASKLWSDLVSSYYKSRWQVFLGFVEDSILNKAPHFPDRDYRMKLWSTMNDWQYQFDDATIHHKATGDEVGVVNKLYSKWVINSAESFQIQHVPPDAPQG